MINRDRTLGMDFVLGCRHDVFLQKSFPRSISFFPAYDCSDSAEIKCKCGTSIYFHQRLNRATVRPQSQLTSEGFYGLDEVVASDCWHHFVTLFSSFKFRHSSEFVTTSQVHIAVPKSLAAQSSSGMYPNFQYPGMVWHRHKPSVPSGFRIERESFSDCIPNYLSYLLAASGMAYRFSSYFLLPNSYIGQRYLAGLWMRNFPSDLCWWVKVIEGHCVPSRAKPYRAPTWSWASVDFDGESPCSPVVYHSNFGQKFEQSENFRIRRAETQLAKSDVGEYTYGSVYGGLLRIKGILIAAQIFIHPYLEADARHTIQFLEADALDDDYYPCFWPNVYLDVQGSFKPIICEPSPAVNVLDLPIAGDLEDKEALVSVDVVEDQVQEDFLCSSTKVWICLVGNIVKGGLCALILKEREKANFRRFERVGYLHNRVRAFGFQSYGWHNNFMRRVERAGEMAVEIL